MDRISCELTDDTLDVVLGGSHCLEHTLLNIDCFAD
jgi:hypothetical protein